MADCMRRAFVPTVHLSDLGSKASRSKFKVGQEVRGRVLERDAASKRILMTLKKALIGSNLPALAHLEV
jgi:ribosomal protein S1